MGSSRRPPMTMYQDMDLVEVDSGSEIVRRVQGILWRKSVLTTCVLAVCLGLLAVLALL